MAGLFGGGGSERAPTKHELARSAYSGKTPEVYKSDKGTLDTRYKTAAGKISSISGGSKSSSSTIAGSGGYGSGRLDALGGGL
jgi:hypothetical protein